MHYHILRVYLCFVIFFFFQAEDGIRDGRVTGVQTCALPISPPRLIAAVFRLHGAHHALVRRFADLDHGDRGRRLLGFLAAIIAARSSRQRNGFRRVGRRDFFGHGSRRLAPLRRERVRIVRSGRLLAAALIDLALRFGAVRFTLAGTLRIVWAAPRATATTTTT